MELDIDPIFNYLSLTTSESLHLVEDKISRFIEETCFHLFSSVERKETDPSKFHRSFEETDKGIK